MKRFLLFLLTIFLLSVVGLTALAQTDYEKYGRIATAVVKEDYPGQDIVDYKYEGRKEGGKDQVLDTFRFEVLENGKLKFVNVIVRHNLKNNKLLTLTVEEG